MRTIANKSSKNILTTAIDNCLHIKNTIHRIAIMLPRAGFLKLWVVKFNFWAAEQIGLTNQILKLFKTSQDN